MHIDCVDCQSQSQKLHRQLIILDQSAHKDFQKFLEIESLKSLAEEI